MELEQVLYFIISNRHCANREVLFSVIKTYSSSATEAGINSIIDYVLETPYNTNYNVLKPLLISLSGGGGGDDSDVVGEGKVGFMVLKS